MTHLCSVCSIISIMQPDSMVYWQAFCRKEIAIPILCPEMGASRPGIPKLSLKTHYMEITWAPTKNAGSNHPPQMAWIQILGRRVPGICVLTSIQRWLSSTMEFDLKRLIHESWSVFSLPYVQRLSALGLYLVSHGDHTLRARCSVRGGANFQTQMPTVPSQFPLSTTTTLTWGSISH